MRPRYLLLELVRQLKNLRFLLFSFLVPVVMLLIFGGAYSGHGTAIDPVTKLPWLVLTTVQMGGYGAMMAALGQSFSIVNERSVGWNRQLRLTSLSGTGYLVSKVISALVVAALSIVLITAVSVLALGTRMDPAAWVRTDLGLWIGVLPFALIAILIGQFARPEFAQPLFMTTFLGMSILGGLWVPLSILPAWVANVSQVVPSYWLNRIGQMGALGAGEMGTPAIVLGLWTAVLAALIVWRYRRDSARA